MSKTKFKQTEIGEIPRWDTALLKDVAVVNEKTIDKEYPHVEIEYIDIAAVDKGRISEIKKLLRSEAPSRAQRIVRDKDILLSTVRPNLKHFAFMKKANPNTIASTGFAVISSKMIDSRFLYYYLTTDRYTDYLSAIADAHTSTYPAFNPDILENSEIPFPPEKEQRAIAKILSDLDEKIELNRQMNKTLESIAQTIFKRWFVGFEFPDKNGMPYKSSGGRLVDSELGEIPEGWSCKEIADCGDVVCGKTPPTADKENYGKDIFFITIPDMRGQAFIIKTERKLSKQGASIQENKELPPLSICISCIATPGLVSITSDFSHTNQQINSIICEKGVSPYFMYYTMLDRSEEIKTMGLGGTATLNLNTGNFSRIKVMIAEPVIMDSFHKLVTPLMETVLSNLKENISLCKIRDSLLPRLMSGRKRVSGD